MLVSEGGAARVPFIADQREEAYRRHARAVRPKLDRSPGEIIDARVYTSSQHDRLAIPAPTYMEYENVRWGRDYGHPEGTYGHTQEMLHELFDRVDDAELPRVTIDAFTGLFPGVPPVPAADESAVAAATGVRGLA